MIERVLHDDGFTGDILLYAFRYTLGRLSYSPSVIWGWMRANKHLLGMRELNLMIVEIDEYLNSKSIAENLHDKNGWRQFRNWIQDYRKQLQILEAGGDIDSEDLN